MKRILSVLFALGLALGGSHNVFATPSTCADGGISPGAACHTSSACATSQGQSFSGQCIGGSSASTTYTRCGSTSPICGTLGLTASSGCGGDAACPTGYVCVSDAGSPSCGTGFSACVKSCSDATTTTTTSSTTTTTAP